MPLDAGALNPGVEWRARGPAGPYGTGPTRDWSIQTYPLTVYPLSSFYPGFTWFYLAMEAIK